MCWITKIPAREWADTTTTMVTTSEMDWHRFDPRNNAADTTTTGYDHDSKNKF